MKQLTTKHRDVLKEALDQYKDSCADAIATSPDQKDIDDNAEALRTIREVKERLEL